MRRRTVSHHLPAVAAGLAGALTLAPALAQEATNHPHVVIYAHQVAAPASHVASAVTVITANEIAQRHLTTLAEALESVPGVSVTQSGGPGTLTEVRLRGAEPNHPWC
jgi:vitamin B12 transporter